MGLFTTPSTIATKQSDRGHSGSTIPSGRYIFTSVPDCFEFNSKIDLGLTNSAPGWLVIQSEYLGTDIESDETLWFIRFAADGLFNPHPFLEGGYGV
jgi:hypothetical protein